MPHLRALAGTPYLFGDDPSALSRAAKVLEKADGLRDRAILAQDRLVRLAAAALDPFTSALRSDLVAESNRIEGYDWTSAQVRELVSRHKDELTSPTRQFLEAVRQDKHTYEVVGLYAAHQLADQLAHADGPLREVDIRELHSVVTGNELYAGRYKSVENEIFGTSHRTARPWEVPSAMSELSAWWSQTTANPVLEAAVVHAWLAHIHPFEDGNGRVCRILANYSLVKAGFPPLILRSDSDRIRYYDALSISDQGDILPLVDLFVQTLSKTVKLMSSPQYVQNVIDDRLLSNELDRYNLWLTSVTAFGRALAQEGASRGWAASYQGVPEIGAFSLLNRFDPDGNCWFYKLGAPGAWPILAFFGFASPKMKQLVADGPFPSVFLATRDDDEAAVHPYRPLWNNLESGLPHEIRIRPGSPRPVQIRWEFELEEHSIRDGAVLVADLVDEWLRATDLS